MWFRLHSDCFLLPKDKFIFTTEQMFDIIRVWSANNRVSEVLRMDEGEKIENINNDYINDIVKILKNINNPKRLKFYYKLISGMEKEEVV